MNTEEDFLYDIGCHKKWKDRYKVNYCNLCDTWTLVCPDCKNASCNGGGCEKCIADFIDFCDNTKHSVPRYLTEDDKKTYEKFWFIKKYIGECLEEGFTEINWKWLLEKGHLCRAAEELFAREIRDITLHS